MKNQYVMTEAQIEAIAAERTQSQTATEGFDGTYLRVLVTGVQAKLGPNRGRRSNTETQLQVLDKVSGPYYAAVLRGVTTPDIAIEAELEPPELARRTRERNRRAVFARTAKSTLTSWTEEGGDMRSIKVEAVTKSQLWADVVAARAERQDPPIDKVDRAQQTILAAVARAGPKEGRRFLQKSIFVLQTALDALDKPKLPKVDGHQRQPKHEHRVSA